MAEERRGKGGVDSGTERGPGPGTLGDANLVRRRTGTRIDTPRSATNPTATVSLSTCPAV